MHIQGYLACAQAVLRPCLGMLTLGLSLLTRSSPVAQAKAAFCKDEFDVLVELHLVVPMMLLSSYPLRLRLS
jgi:hypothetical protein